MKQVMIKAARIAMILVVSLIATGAFAQPQGGDDKGDKIEALRIAFISQRLSLTPDEAQKFWPVYNAYLADLKALRHNFGFGPDKPKPTADQQLDFDQKKLDLKKKYKIQFEATIGKEKVNTLYNLEDEFKQKLKELRDQRQQNRGQGGPGGGRGPGN